MKISNLISDAGKFARINIAGLVGAVVYFVGQGLSEAVGWLTGFLDYIPILAQIRSGSGAILSLIVTWVPWFFIAVAVLYDLSIILKLLSRIFSRLRIPKFKFRHKRSSRGSFPQMKTEKVIEEDTQEQEQFKVTETKHMDTF